MRLLFCCLLPDKSNVPDRVARKKQQSLRYLFTKTLSVKIRNECEPAIDGSDACVTPVSRMQSSGRMGSNRAQVWL